MTTDWTTKTPAEVDARWAELLETEAVATSNAQRRFKLAEAATNPPRYMTADPEKAAAFKAEGQKFLAVARQALLDTEPLDAEYDRRGGWTRAWLVTNTGGHVHSGRNCATCFPTTDFYWLTDVSGMDEAEIVELAGERACTVCYPSAPVETLNRATRLFTPDEERKAADRAEREAKRAEKATKAITAPDGRVLRTAEGDTVATEVSARRQGSAAVAAMLWYGPTHPTYADWAKTVDLMAEAVAAKTGEDADALLAEFKAKGAAKDKRDRKEAEKWAR